MSVTTARCLRCRISSQTTASRQGCPHVTSTGCTMSEMSYLVQDAGRTSVTTARRLRRRVSSQTTASHQGCPHVTSNGCTLSPSLSPDSSPASSPSLSPDSSPASSHSLSPASSPGPHLASHLAPHLPNISDFFRLTYHPPTTSYNLTSHLTTTLPPHLAPHLASHLALHLPNISDFSASPTIHLPPLITTLSSTPTPLT